MALTINTDGFYVQSNDITGAGTSFDLDSEITGLGDGDLLIGAFVSGVGSSTKLVLPSTNGAWTDLDSGYSSSTYEWDIQYRAANTPEASEAWSWGTTTNQYVTCAVVAIAGVDIADPFRADATNTYGNNNTAAPGNGWVMSAPALDAVAGDVLVNIYLADRVDGSYPIGWTAPSGPTVLVSRAVSQYTQMLICAEAIDTDGATGTRDAFQDNGRAGRAISILVKDPDANPPVTGGSLGFMSGAYFG
jgi:hypothetical protein